MIKVLIEYCNRCGESKFELDEGDYYCVVCGNHLGKKVLKCGDVVSHKKIVLEK